MESGSRGKRKLSTTKELEKRSKKQLIEEISALHARIQELERQNSEEEVKERELFECQLKALINTRIYALKKQALHKDPLALRSSILDFLKSLGEHTKVERAYIFLLSSDGKELSDALEWCAKGIANHPFEQLKGVPVSSFPWSMKQFLKDEKVIVVNPALLPEAAAAEQESCRVMSIKSYINIPLFLKGTFIGWLGFDSCYQHKDWSDELSLLQSSKEVLLSQIGQVQSYQYLLDSIDLKNLGVQGENESESWEQEYVSMNTSRTKSSNDFGKLYEALDTAQSSPLLRILVITSQPLFHKEWQQPVDLLNVSLERTQIYTGIEKSNLNAQISFLCEASISSTLHAIKDKYDVIHVSAHGDANGIWLEDSMGCVQTLKIDDFISALSQSTTLKLLVLSACYTEYIGKKILSKMGQISVVVMKGAIEDIAAKIFAESFYERLGSAPVFPAFEAARNAVALSPLVADAFALRDNKELDEPAPHDRFLFLGDTSLSLQQETSITLGCHASYLPEYTFPCNISHTKYVIGRERQMSELIELLQQDSSVKVNVFGPPGIGKTEFVKVVGWWFYDHQYRRFVFWASAQSDDSSFTDLSSLLDLFRSVYKLDFQKDSHLEVKKEEVLKFLKNYKSLLILDSWDKIKMEHRLSLWTFLQSLPIGTNVLITSREALPPLEIHNFELDRLDSSSSRKLFYTTIRNVGYFKGRTALSWEETELLSEIPDLLAGYPLAIIMAASHSRYKSLAQLKHSIQHNLSSILEGVNEITGMRYGVWHGIREVYNTLSEFEKQVFTHVSIFLDDVTIEDVQLIIDGSQSHVIDSSQVDAAVDTLVRKALLRRSSGDKVHFSQHLIIREFAALQLQLSPVQLHAKVIQHFTDKNDWSAFMKCATHLFTLAAKYRQANIASQYFATVHYFLIDLMLQEDWKRAIEMAQGALALEEKFNNSAAKMRLYRYLSELLIFSGHPFDESLIEYLTISHDIALQLNNQVEAEKSSVLIRSIKHQLNPDSTPAVLDFNSAGMTVEEAAHLNTTIAMFEKESGNLSQARQLVELSLKLLEQRKDNNNSNNKGYTAIFLTKLNQFEQAYALRIAVQIALAEKNYEAMQAFATQGLALAKLVHNQYNVAFYLFQLGKCEQHLKHIEKAIEYFNMSVGVAIGIKTTRGKELLNSITLSLALIACNRNEISLVSKLVSHLS